MKERHKEFGTAEAMEPSSALKTASVDSSHRCPSWLRLASDSGRNASDGKRSGKNEASANTGKLLHPCFERFRGTR